MHIQPSEITSFDPVTFFERFAEQGKGVQIFKAGSSIIREMLDAPYSDDGTGVTKEEAFNFVWSTLEDGIIKGITKSKFCCGVPVKVVFFQQDTSDERVMKISCACCDSKLQITEKGERI